MQSKCAVQMHGSKIREIKKMTLREARYIDKKRQREREGILMAFKSLVSGSLSQLTMLFDGILLVFISSVLWIQSKDSKNFQYVMSQSKG